MGFKKSVPATLCPIKDAMKDVVAFIPIMETEDQYKRLYSEDE